MMLALQRFFLRLSIKPGIVHYLLYSIFKEPIASRCDLNASPPISIFYDRSPVKTQEFSQFFWLD